MIDIFTIQYLITEPMRQGTINISFDQNRIWVSCNYKNSVKDGTDQVIQQTFEIDRQQPGLNL